MRSVSNRVNELNDRMVVSFNATRGVEAAPWEIGQGRAVRSTTRAADRREGAQSCESSSSRAASLRPGDPITGDRVEEIARDRPG